MVVQLWMVKIIAIGTILAGIEGKYCNVCINYDKFRGNGASWFASQKSEFCTRNYSSLKHLTEVRTVTATAAAAAAASNSSRFTATRSSISSGGTLHNQIRTFGPAYYLKL